MKSTVVSFVFILLPLSIFAQENLTEKEGVSRTVENGLYIEFDDFTAETSISISDSSMAVHSYQDVRLIVLPMFRGNLEQGSYDYDWFLTLIHEGKEKYFDIEDGASNIPFLVDNERFSIRAEYVSVSKEDSVAQILLIDLSESEWDHIRLAQNVRFRIAGSVTSVHDSTLDQMTRITDKVSELESELENDNNDTVDRSAPYSLQWEGELDRSPMVQPLPSNPTNQEATITMRFEVNPDGTLGRVFSLRKINPELEREVMRTLRSWRFSRLPSGVPQEPQWGTISFRFVLD